MATMCLQCWTLSRSLRDASVCPKSKNLARSTLRKAKPRIRIPIRLITVDYQLYPQCKFIMHFPPVTSHRFVFSFHRRSVSVERSNCASSVILACFTTFYTDHTSCISEHMQKELTITLLNFSLIFTIINKLTHGDENCQMRSFSK